MVLKRVQMVFAMVVWISESAAVGLWFSTIVVMWWCTIGGKLSPLKQKRKCRENCKEMPIIPSGTDSVLLV